MTDSHTPPPPHILAGGLRRPLAPLIRREDLHRLAALGVLRHITAEGNAPLGYTQWQLAEDAQGPHYYREPAGTPEERQAALDAQAAAAHESYLDGLYCESLQAVEELLDRGMWSNILLWITQQGVLTQEYFMRAKTWQYRDPRLQSGAAALGLSDAQLIEILEAARQR